MCHDACFVFFEVIAIFFRSCSKIYVSVTLEGPCIIFAIYIQSNEIHDVVALIKYLLVLRSQLYVFWTVTVHPRELLCRYCMCRYVVPAERIR